MSISEALKKRQKDRTLSKYVGGMVKGYSDGGRVLDQQAFRPAMKESFTRALKRRKKNKVDKI